jgi:hypothetical protein
MHTDGTPRGAFRPIFRLLGYKGKIKALNALMIYSGITLKDISKVQWKKFHDSVVNPTPSIQEDLISIEPEIQFCAQSSWDVSPYSPLENWINTNKRAPIKKKGITQLVTKKECEGLIDEHLQVLDDPFHKSLLYKYPIPFSKSLGVKLNPVDRELAEWVINEALPNPLAFVGRLGLFKRKEGN